jgi:hypothetical protein
MKSIRRSKKALVLGFGALAALASACADSSSVHCRVGADCSSGICNADGTCEPKNATTSGEGGTGGASSSASSGGSGGGTSNSTGGTGGSGGTGSGTGAGGSGICSPNNDGTITHEELPLTAGLSAKFRVASDATIDTTGEKQPDGTRIWDLTTMLSGDHSVVVETMSIEGAWYADKFAGATYATRLSESADLLGVFEVADEGLFLRGVVSPTAGASSTELTYDPKVKVLAFPLKKGNMWQTTSNVSGTLSGVFSFYTETYKAEVDATGKALTPFSEFAVLRVGTDLTRTVGGFPTTTRTYSFVTECFGTVGTIVSQSNETGKEFTSASEARRLSP